MAKPSQRLARRIEADFDGASAGTVAQRLDEVLDGWGRPFDERAQAAIIFLADGNFERFTAGLEAARTDWRDTLVAAGLADEDWPQRLDRRLGDS